MINDWARLYALQDLILKCLAEVNQAFCLGGGTALSRGYYHHRYSEDLDFFVNDRPEFELWRDRCIEAIRRATSPSGLDVEIVLREARFGRIVVYGREPLKIEFINDVPSRVGEPWIHPDLGRLDTRENILANKITALMDRESPKDIADIFWLCCRDGLDIAKAIEGAEGKAAGIFPPIVAQCLERGMKLGAPSVVWIEPLSPDDFQRRMEELIAKIMT